MKEFIDSLPGVARGCWLCEGNNKRNSDRVKVPADLIERQFRSGETPGDRPIIPRKREKMRSKLMNTVRSQIKKLSRASCTDVRCENAARNMMNILKVTNLLNILHILLNFSSMVMKEGLENSVIGLQNTD